MKVRIRWTETATYEVEIETQLTPLDLRADEAGGGTLWFAEVDKHKPDWATGNLAEVIDRELDEIEVLDPVVSQ